MRAIAAGQQAARDGQPVTACPHPRGDLLRTAWVRGYAQAAPPPAED
nr:Rmf/CrpP fold protein [Kitasatospora viridis]